MWPFQSKTGELEKRVTIVEAQVAAMRAEYLTNMDKISEASRKMLARAGSRDYQEEAAAEKEELQKILGGVDIASLMKNPEAIQAALKNPAVVQFAMKLLAKEVL